MRTVTLDQVLKGIARRVGMDPTSGEYTNEWVAQTVAFLNQRMEEIWTAEWWPECMVMESMAVPPVFDTTKTYWLPDEIVKYAALYYRNIYPAKHADLQPDMFADAWELLDEGDVYLSLQHSTRGTWIESVRGVWTKNPRIDTTALRVEFRPEGERIYLGPNSTDPAWVEYRKMWPQFDVTAWASGTLQWDTVRYYNGDCWRVKFADTANQYNVAPALGSTVWERQEIPKLFARWLEHAVAADHFLDQERLPQADRAQGKAESELLALKDRVIKQQDQSESVRWASQW